jgi:hypothetical protein
MTTLTWLGIASLVFVIGFTGRAWVQAEATGLHRQSRRQAMVEAWTNIVIGFSINAGLNLLLLPLVGAHVSASQNFWLGVVYTAVSLVRSYVIRRYCDRHIHHFAARAAGKTA